VEEVGAPGRQIAIFGERGVGKTSLAILAYFFVSRDEDERYYARCTKNSTYDSVFSDVLTDAGVPVALNGFEAAQSRTLGGKVGPLRASRRGEGRATYRPWSSARGITPRVLLEHFADREGLIIVDEFDRVADPDTHTRMAETLKHFSDARSKTKLVVVGVADTVSHLVREHQSLTRCLASIRLAPMSDEELGDLVARGERRLSVTFRDSVKHRIVRLSDGFPHFAHLLALYSAQEAGETLLSEPKGSLVVDEEEYESGLRLALENAEPQLIEDFERAVVTVKRKSEKFELVLGALALSSERQVQVRDIGANASLLAGEECSSRAFSYHLGQLVKSERASILTRVREGYYRFTNPLMRPYIRLRLELDNVLHHRGQFLFPFMQPV